MTIEKHEYKKRIVLDLEENEFVMLAYLIEKSSRQTLEDNIVEDPLDVKMNFVFRDFLGSQ